MNDKIEGFPGTYFGDNVSYEVYRLYLLTKCFFAAPTFEEINCMNY